MWHDTYLQTVLRPDYDYARAHLLPHLFDALSAHAWMLDQQGVTGAARALELLRELRREPFPAYDPSIEDVFFTLDLRLGQADAQAAGALRTALSRNDLDMTIYRLSARSRLMRAVVRLITLRLTLLDLAGRERETLIVAYTHHQPAQPTTLAHYLCGLENVLARDVERLFSALTRLNLCPMGAVALGGTSFPIDRDLTAELLAFDRPIENTYDAVSTSDWQVEIAGTITTAATTLSRAVHDLLFWASRGLLTLADGLVQGSSVMPQKRNPVALEHARTKLSKAIGASGAVVLSAHNVPFGDINDPGPDMQPPLHTMWQEFGEAVDLLTVTLLSPGINRRKWREEAEGGEAAITELADALAQHDQGGFREAHAAVKALLLRLHQAGRKLSEVTGDDLAAVGVNLPEAVWRSALDPANFVARRTTYGGPAPETISQHLTFARQRLEADGQQHETATARFAAARAALADVHLDSVPTAPSSAD
ncbi:argininosuccinate lyase (plasmid) [Deinococcus psychrotolerans]|uniref:argininosuccinate lyase n=1 Tax=Deinococcus psychrotolerans TaxID=2489213 RepID=A0A3G8YPW4_9DEIO|nr:lyase family protein [Deinococcus psychrotolerans]AZI44644.1 argininosuccinate lyase [Deinococcus psychrotolerans]